MAKEVNIEKKSFKNIVLQLLTRHSLGYLACLVKILLQLPVEGHCQGNARVGVENDQNVQALSLQFHHPL